jgi:hypothetical protein
MDYDLGDRGLITSKGKFIILLQNVRSGSGAHPASYPMGTGGSIPGPRRESDDSPPSSADVKRGGAIPPLPH